MLETVTTRELRDFIKDLCDSPAFNPLPNHYRLALAQFTAAYHEACLEGDGRHRLLLNLLHRIRRLRSLDQLVGAIRRKWQHGLN